MQLKEIVYFDRYQGKTCVEKIYGDKYMRWTYGTLGGKIALAAMVKRAWFSRWYGWRMDRPGSRRKIGPFIDEYGLDPNEFIRLPEEFESFNAFFSRSLKLEARPVDPNPSTVVFPQTGAHLCVPDLSRCDGLLVKGEMFDLQTLLGDAELAREFADGSLLLSRLCPVDYHRFHFPLSGRAGPTRLLNGPLFSVNPIALCQNIHILATNKRTLSVLETESLGKVLLMEIGATNVGSISQTYQADSTVSKGDEKGYFRFGGSSTITIFKPRRVQFEEDLLSSSAKRRELYAKMGDRMGQIV